MRPGLAGTAASHGQVSILSQLHPVAAGLFNTAQFVIVEQAGAGGRQEEEKEERPHYTYRELIRLALQDRTQLTLANIYQWIRWQHLQQSI